MTPRPDTLSRHTQLWGQTVPSLLLSHCWHTHATKATQHPCPATRGVGAGRSQKDTSGMTALYGRRWKTGALSLRSSTMMVIFWETYQVSERAQNGCVGDGGQQSWVQFWHPMPTVASQPTSPTRFQLPSH